MFTTVMPHPGRHRPPRDTLPPAANFFAPVIIFFVCLFVVHQVNHHTKLQALVHEQELKQGEHFATGGRKAQESGQHGDSLQVVQAPVQDTTTRRMGGGLQLQEEGDTCHPEQHVEYHGEVVQWGSQHLQPTAEACCSACKNKAGEGCNVWVWCGEAQCGKSAKGECWLKKASLDSILDQFKGKGHPDIPWTSGVLYTPTELAAYQAKKQAAEAAEAARLAALKANQSLPLVYLDVSIKGQPVGRMEFVLFTHISPLAAECMRRLCTGEVSAKHTLKGATFYRIIDQFIDQTGIEVHPSPLGGTFKDDQEGLKLKHDRKGLLSVANRGHDTNDGHFSILMNPAPHLNKGYVIFGEMVSGWEVAVKVNALSKGKPNNELLYSPDAVITDVGQLRRGVPVPDSVIKAGLVKGM